MFLITVDFIIYYQILIITNNIQYNKLEYNRICYIQGNFPTNVKHITEEIRYVVYGSNIFDLRRDTNYTVITQENDLNQNLHVGMILEKLQECEEILLQNCHNIECSDYRLNDVHVNNLNFIKEYVADLTRLVTANVSYALSQHKTEFNYLKGLASKISENADNCAKINLGPANLLKENTISKHKTFEQNFDSLKSMRLTQANQSKRQSNNNQSQSNQSNVVEPIVDIKSTSVKKEYTLENFNCSFEECSVGNLIADSIVAYLTMRRVNDIEKNHWTTAAVAVVCSTSIHGNVTVRNQRTDLVQEIQAAIPASQELIIITLRGDILMSLLMDGVRPLKHEDGTPIGTESFLQVSGIQMFCNVDKTQGIVSEVLLRCHDCMEPKYEPLNYTRYYPVIIQQAVAEGLFGHRDTFHNNHGMYRTHKSDVEAVEWYCNIYKHIIPGRQRRIIIQYDDYPAASSIFFLESLLLVNIFVLLFCK